MGNTCGNCGRDPCDKRFWDMHEACGDWTEQEVARLKAEVERLKRELALEQQTTK